MDNRSILTDSDVRWDEREGRPRKVRGVHMPVADTAEDSIRVFLSANADELRLGVSDENLKVIQDVSTPVRRIVRFQRDAGWDPSFRRDRDRTA